MLLATISDGVVDETERQLLKNYRELYPQLKGLNEELVQETANEINKKFTAGFSNEEVINRLLNDIKLGSSRRELETYYALAFEICASNFKLVDAELNFLSIMKDVWDIPDELRDSLQKSIELRYGITL